MGDQIPGITDFCEFYCMSTCFPDFSTSFLLYVRGWKYSVLERISIFSKFFLVERDGTKITS